MSMWAKKQTGGFTIVELLIVIVVIAILAAITIVAYNGITTRAKTTASQTSSSTVVKKALAFYVEKGYYPTAVTDMTGAASTDSFFLTGITFTTLTNIRATPPPAAGSVNYAVCGSGSPASLAAINSSNVVGGAIYYRDYSLSGTGSEVLTPIGVTGGSGVLCITST